MIRNIGGAHFGSACKYCGSFSTNIVQNSSDQKCSAKMVVIYCQRCDSLHDQKLIVVEHDPSMAPRS